MPWILMVSLIPFKRKYPSAFLLNYFFFFLASFHVPQTDLELSNIAENGVELLILLPLPNWCWGLQA